MVGLSFRRRPGNRAELICLATSAGMALEVSTLPPEPLVHACSAETMVVIEPTKLVAHIAHRGPSLPRPVPLQPAELLLGKRSLAHAGLRSARRGRTIGLPAAACAFSCGLERPRGIAPWRIAVLQAECRDRSGAVWQSALLLAQPSARSGNSFDGKPVLLFTGPCGVDLIQTPVTTTGTFFSNANCVASAAACSVASGNNMLMALFTADCERGDRRTDGTPTPAKASTCLRMPPRARAHVRHAIAFTAVQRCRGET